MSKNLHLTHIEDSIFYGGIDGTKKAIDTLYSVRDIISGKQSHFNVTVKWDGAPALFAGSHPAIANGKFFVAKKSIFNKNPKVYTSNAEIEADTSGDLAVKLKASLQYLSKLNINGIIQGDLMFTESDKQVKEINGQKYILFQPNTVVYGAPFESELGQRIHKSRFGIVFHTRYEGDSLENMKAYFDVDVNHLTETDDVWFQDAQLNKCTAYSLFSHEENKLFVSALTSSKALLDQIDQRVIAHLFADRNITQMFETYNNKLVREGKTISNANLHVKGLIEFIQSKFQVEIDKRKTAKGKERQQEKLDQIMQLFCAENIKYIESIFKVQKNIVKAKLRIIRKLEAFAIFDTFVQTKVGYKVTGEEGYVVIDTSQNSAYKLVDRMEFSSKNFNPDIIKGWQR